MADLRTVTLSDGGRVDWWLEQSTQRPSESLVHVQKFDAAGNTVGGAYSVTTQNAPGEYDVVALNNGGYVVATTALGMDGPSFVGDVFNAAASEVTTVRSGGDWNLAASPGGGFLVDSVHTVYHGATAPDSDILMFNNSGAVVSSEAVSSRQLGPDVAVDAQGVFQVSWSDGGGNAHVLAFDPAHPPTYAAPPAPASLSILDDVGARQGALRGGGGTDDATPTIRIEAHQTGWVAVGAGGAGSFGANTPLTLQNFTAVTANDAARGYVDVPISGALTDGNYAVGARFESSYGVLGPQTWVPLRVDTQPPAAPTITRAVDDTGAQPADVPNGGTTADTSPTIYISLNGTGAQDHDSLLVFDRGQVVNVIPIDVSDVQRGYVTHTAPASAGSHAYTAGISDFAGNQGANSAPFNLAVSGGSGSGSTIVSHQYGDTLVGGAGNDTLQAGQGPDQLTGAGGADMFAFGQLPWNAGHVTDFTMGADKLDLSALFRASGYTGSDPIRDHYVSLQSDSAGGTVVYYDTDGPASGNTIQYKIITLDHVAGPATWAQLTGGGGAANQEVNISPATVSHAEGQSGVTAFTFTITRTGDLSQGATTSTRVVPSGAHPADASDFQNSWLPNGTFGWSPGESSHTITINVAGDTTVESDETFSVVLSTPTGGTSNGTPIGPNGTAIGIIVNDDGASGGAGQVYNSPGPNSTLTGGAGNDTLNASQGADVLTGNGGADSFAYALHPWTHGRITDFHIGEDRLDVSGIFRDMGYAGADPVADSYVRLVNNLGGTDTLVYIDADGPGAAHQWDGFFTTLEGVYGAGGTRGGVSTLSWAQLTGGGSAQPPPPAGEGQVLTSHREGDTLTGGAGNDTLNAGQGPDRLTGGGGADNFVFQNLPWNAGHVTDFTPGADKIDLRGLFQGYAGTDPLADHTLEFRPDGSGGTQVYVDHDGPNTGDWPFLITTLDGVTPGQIGAGDWIWR